MALTVEQLQDYINANVKKNGRNAITGDIMNYLMLQFVDWVDSYSALPSYPGNSLKYLRVNAAETGTEWHTLTKSDVGLSNVDNTADIDKPLSTATTLALSGKQDTLVSGTNIKTLNGATLLGSGNITLTVALTVGTTSISSGTAGRVLYEGAGNVLQEDAGFLFDPTNKTLTNYGKGATSTNTSFGIGVFQNGTGAGAQNTVYGWGAANYLTSATGNAIFGYRAGGGVLAANFTGTNNSLFGNGAGLYLSSGIQNTFLGGNTGTSITTGSYNTIVGHYTGSLPAGCAQYVILSDGSGAVALWKDGSNRIGFGHDPLTATLAAKVDIKSPGALSSDLAFKIRNSSNTHDLYNIAGDGSWIYRNNANTGYLYYNATGGWEFQQSGVKYNLTVAGFTTLVSDGSTGIAIGSLSHRAIMYKDGNFQIEAASGILQTSGQGGFSLKNGTAPSAFTADRFTMYSADITAGLAAPHFYLENNDIVKIYSIGGWGTPTGTLTRTTYVTYTSPSISSTPTQAEVQAISDHLQIISERQAAIISDLKTGHQLFKA